MNIYKKFVLAIALLLVVFSCKTTDKALQDPIQKAPIEQVLSTIIRGEKIHYSERGAGEPLIFVHGTVGDYRAWTSRMEPYSKEYHVVAYSRRYAYPNEQKFVESVDYSVRIHADDLYALIQELGFEKVHIIGHSYGAFTALTMALDHPEVVRSLVLGEPPAASLLENVENGDQLFNSFLENDIRPAARAFRSGKNEKGVELFLKGVMGDDFTLNDVPPEVKQAWMDNLLELWGSAINESFLELDIAKIQNLDIPTLLFIGDRSPPMLVEISKELDRLLPNSQIVTLQNSSHGLYFEQPKAADQAMMQFLKRN